MKSKFNNTILLLSLITMITAITSANAVKAVKVYSKENTLSQSNETKPSFYVKNTGDITISSYIVYYYFTTENDKTPVLNDWYTPNSTLSLEDLGNGDHRVKFDYDNVNLSPGQEITPSGNSWGLHFSDWSDWDKSNDYSNNLSSDFAENQKIVVYEQGEQNPLYGTPPGDANSAPIAENVFIGGYAESGVVLSGEYDYQDAENDLEGQSTYKWYRADDYTGTNAQAIIGETDQTYTLVNDDIGEYICFEVTPYAQTGSSPGAAVKSSYEGPVVAAGGGSADFKWPSEVNQAGIDMKVDGDSEFYGEVYLRDHISSTVSMSLDNLGIRIYQGGIQRYAQIAGGHIFLRGSEGTVIINDSKININSHVGTTRIDGPVITTGELLVTKSAWADHVFKPEYKLNSLNDLEKYIEKNGHLPNIPTEEEVREKGLNVGDMQAKLLGKIEEMTLLMIKMHKRIDALEAGKK